MNVTMDKGLEERFSLTPFMKGLFSEPLEIFSISGIPVVITQEHHEAYYFWRHSNIEDAVLFHVDAHPDMISHTVCNNIFEIIRHLDFSIANFICPAFHYGIVSSIYWLNPHSEERRLQFLGSSNAENSEERLKTKIDDGYDSKEFVWVAEPYEKKRDIHNGERKVISSQEIELNGQPLILDIDLDAFCCHKNIFNKSDFRSGTRRYKTRILESIEVLAYLKNPDLITITRSQSEVKDDTYVPSKMVDEVQQNTLNALRDLYG